MTMTDAPETPNAYSEAERAAMRAYLQRTEVRISTLHRIISSFLGGAGLLLLVPVFFKDVVDSIIQVLLDQAVNQYPGLGEVGGSLLTGLLFLFLLYPLVLSLVVPLYGVYLLLKDIIHFYFTIYTPDLAPDLLSPAFTLGGLSFPEDESPRVKRDILRYQYRTTSIRYVVPFSDEKRKLYFDKLIADTEGQILPPTRSIERLQEMDVLPPDVDHHAVEQFNAALGVARSLDHTLAQEVALQEMILVRYVMYLRRLVLRYVKILLMFIWTMFVAFIMLPFLEDERFPALVVLSVGYLVWSAVVMPLLSTPINWFYRHRYGQKNPDHIDAQLLQFENGVEKYTHGAVFMAILALVMSILIEL
jgi:hypothetical protein